MGKGRGRPRSGIRGEDVEDTTVRRELRYRGGEPEDSWSVDDGVLTLRGCGRNCSVHYTIVAPELTPVSGHTSNGSLVLSHLGPVDVESSNGSIEVVGDGPVEARTSNGSTEAHVPQDVTATHRLQLTTSNGDIKVEREDR